MAHPNEELLRSAQKTLDTGDMDAFLQLHTEDVKFHVPGKSPVAGDTEGRDAMGGVFGKLSQILDGPPEFDLHDALADDEHGYIVAMQTMTRGGKTVEVPLAIVFHFRDGKVSEVWLHTGDQYALDELLS